MKVTNNTIYVLTVNDTKEVFDREEEAIEELRENSDEIDDDGENISIVEVSIGEDNWEIAEVPWQKIAFKLL